MALGKKCRSFTGPKRGGLVSDEGLELGPVRYFSTSFGRKRIVISNLSGDSSPKTPTKKRCGGLNTVVMDLERSPLEALPNDVLVSPNFAKLSNGGFVIPMRLASNLNFEFVAG